MDFSYVGSWIDPTSDGTNNYTRGPLGGLLAQETNGSIWHPFDNTGFDLFGLISPDGTLAGSTTYNPFGEVDHQNGQTSLLGYQSDWTDPATEHVWMGARWYQPSTATFLSRDTYFGELQTPFSLNRYTYAHNNPERYWDPDGRAVVIEPGTPHQIILNETYKRRQRRAAF